MKPLMKWAGGKRWFVEHLRMLHAPHSHRVYCEPFAGGMAGALALEPPRAYLSDANPWLMNFYSHVRMGFSLSSDLVNDKTTFLRHRAEFNALTKHQNPYTARVGELFWYLIKTDFNGLCRFNRSGEFNVPMGRNKSVSYNIDFQACQQLMQGWTFACHSFEAVAYPADWFIFADPPYFRTFTGYNPTPFAWAEQVRLADMLGLHPGPVVTTNSSEPEVLELYRDRGFDLELVTAPRRISCKAGERKDVKEMVATRNL